MADVVKKPDPEGGGTNSSNSHEMARLLNIDTAKLFALAFVAGFILYHGSMHLKSGGDSCLWLISDGRFQGYGHWQPYGCMMHKYTKQDSTTCMHDIAYWGGNNHIAFVGDSRIRQLYLNFKSMFSDEAPPKDGEKHKDLRFINPKFNLKLEFKWQPYVDTDMYTVYREWINSEIAARPNIVVTSSATWTIKNNNATDEALADFKRKLILLRRLFTQMHNTTKVLWMMQAPVEESKLSTERSLITNKQIDLYNKAARDYLVDDHKSVSYALLWSSSRLIAQGYRGESTDGVHAGPNSLALDTQTLLNMYCNDHMNFVDGTCCRNSEPVTKEQIGFGIAVLVCIVATTILYIYRRKIRKNGCGKPRAENNHRNGGTTAAKGKEKPKKSCVDSCYDLLFALTKFGLILGYCFLCDRTNFFMKENKNYSAMNFFLPLAYVMVLGFFFTDDLEQCAVLNRDQTDEWKGWMQLVILIYHQTGASKQIPIYMWVRCLVSSYLFMTGYGHFTFFWKKGEYKVYRLCQVLFRMNALVIGLCFAMNRPYQFYYFVPLVTFWFLVVYLTMAIWPHLTQKSADDNVLHYFYMVLKFMIVTVVMSLVYATEILFDKVFLTHPIKALFVTADDSIHEWRFRWGLDRYSVLWGMVFAFGYLFMKKLKLFNDMTRDTIFSKTVSWTLLGLSVFGLGGYQIFVSFCGSKPHCNEVHSYIAFIPITSFVLLRNIPGWLRTRYSSFFAWFGKISLELFIAQYHIWLAADTHGILVLVPSYPVLNIIITSFIFVCIAHELSKVTGIIANFAVPADWKLLLRNSVIFLLILLPVGIRHGVFGF